MNERGARFDTGVDGIWGIWPERPPLWSYSSLREIEECPRRWMLTRATYPDVWDRRGYPVVQRSAALLGDVVHGALDAIVVALNRAGCTSAVSAEAVNVIRELGGLSAVLRETIDDKIASLADNPRLNDETVEGLRQALTDQLGLASHQVQVLLSRGKLPVWAGNAETEALAGGAPGLSGPRRRSPVGSGAHPEVDVVAEELRLWGRIDLLTVDEAGVTITDYKTGLEDPLHDDQVLLYALLWDLDRHTNPECRSATALVLSYPTRERAVAAPDGPALRALEAASRARIERADAETATSEPRALPAPDTCAYCQVRQLCPEYWDQVAPDPAAVPPMQWFDLEGTVVRQNGIKSWLVEATRGGGVEILVRTPSPSVTLPVRRTLRLIGVRRVVNSDEPDKLIAVLGSSSERFLLDE